MEQPKSITVEPPFERNSSNFVLTEGQVLDCPKENLDVTAQRHNAENEESDVAGTTDLMSYNNDVHAYDRQQFSPISQTAPSLSDHNKYISLPDERHSVTVLTEETRSKSKTDKVYILHFTDEDDASSKDAILRLASSLRHFHVDVTLDLFEQDNFNGNWNMWHERELKESKIVLCIITEDFYTKLTSDHIKGSSAYNLLSDGNISFIPVFLESQVNKKHIPLSMRGSNVYSIPLRDIPNVRQSENWSEKFQSLYSFLTTQNRKQPPKLGEVVPLPRNKIVMSEEEKIFERLKEVRTPVKSLPSHNIVFTKLVSNLVVEWEPLGRRLGVSEANMYAIKRDNMHSVNEQAVKMFQQWLRQNGSAATIGVLATALYNAGPRYHQLLEVLNKHII